MSAHVAVIVGLSGIERYLSSDNTLGQAAEVLEKSRACRFRSPEAAREAAQAHLQSWPACISRHMAVRVEAA